MADRTALSTHRSERGQAALEFIFSMFILMALIALLFQALHFELDVFNKTMVTRYNLLDEARKDEDETRPRMISETIEGKQLGDLIPWDVPFQTETDLRYGPKEVYWQCGTKYLFPGGDTAEGLWNGGITALLIVDHAEQFSGNSETLFDVLGDASGGLGDACL